VVLILGAFFGTKVTLTQQKIMREVKRFIDVKQGFSTFFFGVTFADFV